MIQGLCGEHTQQKQEIFSKFIEHHINIVKLIYQNKGQWNPYLYFDLFAGPGFIQDNDFEGFGSPILFNRLMRLEDINYQMIVAEINNHRRNTLREWLALENAPFTIKNNALECCPSIVHKWHFGIIYIDPPMDKQSFLDIEKLIPQFVKFCPQTDIVFYISAATVKRLTNASHVPFDKKVIEYLHPDKEWVIREPVGKGQYTFLVGTKKDMTWHVWGNEKFHPVNSYDGQRILKRLNYTNHKLPFDDYGMEQGNMF